MVELLEGEISVVSQVEQGSTFSVSIPYKGASSVMEKHEVNLGEQKFRKDQFILVIEDNLMNQALIEALFEELEMEIQFADNGKKGLETVLQLLTEGHLPDLIFMDMQMPIMGGIEATRQIRTYPEFQDIPIIALSADAFTNQQKGASDVGINDYLTKPIDMDKLIPILKKYLS